MEVVVHEGRWRCIVGVSLEQRGGIGLIDRDENIIEFFLPLFGKFNGPMAMTFVSQ